MIRFLSAAACVAIVSACNSETPWSANFRAVMSFADDLQADSHRPVPEVVSPENGQPVAIQRFCSEVILENYQRSSNDDPVLVLKQMAEDSGQDLDAIHVCRVVFNLCDAGNACSDTPRYEAGVRFVGQELSELSFSTQRELNLLGEPVANGSWTARSVYDFDDAIMFTKVHISHYAVVVETFGVAHGFQSTED